MTPQQCLYTDWYDEGWQTAMAGKPVTELFSVNGRCNLHGIHIDRAAYVSGWSAGRDHYLESTDQA